MNTIETPATSVAPPASAPASGREFQPFGEDGFTFFDFVDIINPLQHLPVVSTLYRRVTGDTLDPGTRFLGGTLFGGPFGALSATVNIIVEAESGKDIGEHVATAMFGEPDNPIFVADAEGTSASPPTVATSGPAAGIFRAGAAAWTPVVDLAALVTGPVPDVAETADEPKPVAVRVNRQAPIGATAAEGGWFTESMLSALRKYEEAVSAGQSAGPSVSRTI